MTRSQARTERAETAGRRAPLPGLRERVTARLPLLTWLVLVWTGLWGDLTAANLLGGLAVGAAVLVLLPLPAVRGGGRLRPVPALRLVGVFAVDLLRANLVVAVQVLRVATGLGRPPRRAVVACPLRGGSDRLTTVVANMISLTPGTLTVEIDRLEAVLYVHVLDLESVDGLRAEVQDLEARVVRALGSDDALARLRMEPSGPQPAGRRAGGVQGTGSRADGPPPGEQPAGEQAAGEQPAGEQATGRQEEAR